MYDGEVSGTSNADAIPGVPVLNASASVLIYCDEISGTGNANVVPGVPVTGTRASVPVFGDQVSGIGGHRSQVGNGRELSASEPLFSKSIHYNKSVYTVDMCWRISFAVPY